MSMDQLQSLLIAFDTKTGLSPDAKPIQRRLSRPRTVGSRQTQKLVVDKVIQKPHGGIGSIEEAAFRRRQRPADLPQRRSVPACDRFAHRKRIFGR